MRLRGLEDAAAHAVTDDDSISSAGPTSVGSAAFLFAGVWDALADILGTAATATLVRRAIREARAHSPTLEGLTITQENFEYRYELPTSWSADSECAIAELRVLARQLTPLLSELTGPVVLHRLRSLPQVGDTGLFDGDEEEP